MALWAICGALLGAGFGVLAATPRRTSHGQPAPLKNLANILTAVGLVGVVVGTLWNNRSDGLALIGAMVVFFVLQFTLTRHGIVGPNRRDT